MNDHANTERNLVSAWLQAADDLGIAIDRDVVTPVDAGDDVIWPVRVMQFGRAHGIVVCLGGIAPEEEARRRRAAEAAGLAVSFLSPSYCTYDRRLFASTLNDWGWRGPGDAPAWYTGESWTP